MLIIWINIDKIEYSLRYFSSLHSFAISVPLGLLTIAVIT